MKIKVIQRIFLSLLISQIFGIKAAPHISADFECGSIGEYTLREHGWRHTIDGEAREFFHYNIITRVDPENPAVEDFTPNNRWFYFMASGVKGREMIFNITYNDSKRALYSYDNENFVRFSDEEAPIDNRRISKLCERDTIYIAYYTPYSLTRSGEKIEQWSESPRVASFEIGRTAEDRAMEMIVIANDLHEGLIPDINGEIKPRRGDRKKEIIYIHSRIHPSETPASWHTEALIERLLSTDTTLLESAIFYILPIANPDGVAEGFSRSNSIGIDLEGNYDNPEATTGREVAGIKRFLTALKKANLKPTIALNLHAQSASKASYWIHTAASTNKRYNRKLKELASLTTLNNRNLTMRDMDFSTLRAKYVEGWIRKQFNGKTMAMTHELPYTYFSSRRDGEWVDHQTIEEQARHTLDAINFTAQLDERSKTTMEEPRWAKGFRRTTKKGELNFSGRSLTSKYAGAMVRYKGELPKGYYNVYMCSAGGKWNKIGECRQSSDGRYKYSYRSKSAGEKVDRIIFVMMP